MFYLRRLQRRFCTKYWNGVWPFTRKTIIWRYYRVTLPITITDGNFEKFIQNKKEKLNVDTYFNLPNVPPSPFPWMYFQITNNDDCFFFFFECLSDLLHKIVPAYVYAVMCIWRKIRLFPSISDAKLSCECFKFLFLCTGLAWFALPEIVVFTVVGCGQMKIRRGLQKKKTSIKIHEFVRIWS